MSTTFPHGSKSTRLQEIKATASEVLVDFDQSVLRNVLIQAAGGKLSTVAKSSAASISGQLETIRHSISEFDAILDRMTLVQKNVDQILSNVSSVVREVESSSNELNCMSSKVQDLELNIVSIDGLVRTVNDIADRTHLLSLNATIEAARAGDAGRGFAVVADEVKELATTTKRANREIQETLQRITNAASSLSVSVAQAVSQMHASVEAVELTRQSADTIGTETNAFSARLQDSLQNFNSLNESSSVVENEMQEISTIGETFSYLLELMAIQGVSLQTIDPLERLLPVVAQSDFSAQERFAKSEPEYQLRSDDILISATDTKGKITFANNCFYRIAEYKQGELVGVPHNIIRHPHMPRTAFADLWAVIKSGKLWQGYVANRSKSGRIYWVKANVFPCFRKGEIVGYISVRTKPDAEAVRQAIEAYRLVP